MNSDTDTILTKAVTAGLTAAGKVNTRREDTFRAAFVNYIRDNGGTEITAQSTSFQDEAETGADVILQWPRGTSTISCYLQIKLLYPNFGEYVQHRRNAHNANARANGEKEISVDDMWRFIKEELPTYSSEPEDEWFDVMYQSIQEGPYYGRYQAIRMNTTVTALNNNVTPHIAEAGFLLVASDTSNACVLSLKSFAANGIYFFEQSTTLPQLTGYKLADILRSSKESVKKILMWANEV